MLKKTKRIIFYVSGIVILIIVICLLAFPYKKTKNNVKTQYQEQFPNKPTVPLTEPVLNNNTSPNDDIPAEREDINSQLTLEQRKRGQKLSPVEEKTIVESLASQVSINKDKSFFDYK